MSAADPRQYFYDHTYHGPACPLLGDVIQWDVKETISGAFHIDLRLMGDVVVVGEGGKRWLIHADHAIGLQRA